MPTVDCHAAWTAQQITILSREMNQWHQQGHVYLVVIWLYGWGGGLPIQMHLGRPSWGFKLRCQMARPYKNKFILYVMYSLYYFLLRNIISINCRLILTINKQGIECVPHRLYFQRIETLEYFILLSFDKKKSKNNFWNLTVKNIYKSIDN